MACSLTPEEVKNLITDLKNDIVDRIEGRRKTKFNLKEYSVELFNDIKEDDNPARGLQVIQAVPYALHLLIAKNASVRDYFLDNNIPREYFKEERDFEDLMKVADYVKILSPIRYEVVKANIDEVNEKKGYSYAKFLEKAQERTALSPSVLTTSFMPYYPIDPKKPGPNVVDEEKVYISKAVKKIIDVAKRTNASETEVVYDGTPVYLRAVPLTSLDQNLLVSYDTNFIEQKPEKAATVVVAVVTDINGNPLFFNKETSKLEDSKTASSGIVYQEIYKVKKTKEGYEILNRSDNRTAVLSPENLAQKEYDGILEAQGLDSFELLTWEKETGKLIKKQLLAKYKKKFDNELKSVFNLQNKALQNPNEKYLISITDGSYGTVEKMMFPLNTTGFELNGPLLPPSIVGDEKGYVRVPVTNTEGEQQDVLLNRGNIDAALIEKIADVITTTAKLKGQQLTREARQRYADIMVTGVPGNKISLMIKDINSVDQLVLRLGNTYIYEDTMFTPETKQKIIDHLTDIVELENGTFLNANINIHAGSVNQDFIDYEISGDTITTVSKSYDTFIKPYLLIQISENSGEAWGSRNPQFAFVIPEEIQNLDTESADINAVTETLDDTRYEITDETKVGEINPIFKRGKKIDTLTENINQSDATINVFFRTDRKDEATFTNKNAPAEKIVPIKLGRNKRITQTTANALAQQLNDKNASVINITGNNILGIRQSSSLWFQKDIDAFMLDVLSKVVPQLNVADSEIVILTTGETGVSEAAVKAAKELGLTTEITIPGTYKITKARKSGKKVIEVNAEGNKDAFLERFEEEKRARKKGTRKPAAKKKSTKTDNKKYTRKKANYASKSKSKKGKPKTTKKGKKLKPKTLSQEEQIAARKATEDQIKALKTKTEKRNLFDEDDGLFRAKDVSTFFDRLFTTKAQKDKATEWFNTKSNLAGTIPLQVITEVVNSDAFAKWTKYGIILYEADGGTPVDLYHEAWHGFSQLFLTRSEKEDLYDSIQEIPKYENFSYLQIEEKLAEEFRTYGKRQSTTLGRVAEAIFKRIRAFLSKFLGFMPFVSAASANLKSLRDYPQVAELFDQLYKGEILELEPSMDNIYPEFHVLNSLKNTIQLTKKEADNYEDFTVDETNTILNTLDNIVASLIRSQAGDAKSSVIKRALENPTIKSRLYNFAYEDLVERRDQIDNILDKLVIKNAEDNYKFEQLFSKVNLLNKTLNNFGEPELVITGKQKTGVLAYYLENSRFSNIKEIFEDEMTDEGQMLAEESQDVADMEQYYTDKINNFDPKTLASDDTKAIIGLLPMIEKNAKGEYEVVQDEFGFEQLENPDIMYNRVSKVTAGSLDYADMHKRLTESSLNYPQFITLLDMMRAPGEEYKNDVQFKQETNFLQDLSKPRVPFKQLNITKKLIEKADFESGRPARYGYDLGVANATFSTRNVIRDWTSSFFSSTPETNDYIKLVPGLNNPMLDLAKIVDSKDFEINGRFDPQKSLQFLEAIGLPMDQTSYEINTIASNALAFSKAFQLELVYATVKQVREKMKSPSVDVQAAAQAFAMDPVNALRQDLPKVLQTKDLKSTDVKNRINLLAQLQVQYSDKFSNFSTTLPTDDRVWEQQFSSTIIKHLQALNTAENWQQLTGGIAGEADPTQKFKHMYWLSESNNTFPTYSKLLNSLFYIEGGVEKQGARYGERRTMVNASGKVVPVKLEAFNVGGTKLINERDARENAGSKTAGADVTSKFLQELNSLLLGGIEEFMRHASKNTAMGITAQNIKTQTNKKSKNLYIDVASFRGFGNGGVVEGLNIMEGYLFGEMQRMFRYTKDKNVIVGDNKVTYSDMPAYSRQTLKRNKANPTEFVDAGSAFTAFSDILTWETQKVLYDLIDSTIKAGEVLNLEEVFDNDLNLREAVRADITEYFEKVSDNNFARYQKAGYFDKGLINEVMIEGFTEEDAAKSLIDAYSWNSWIHKFETTIVGYGDVVQYNHAKEEFHKRNPFLATGAKTLRADADAIMYANNEVTYGIADKMGVTMPKYDGTFSTAIFEEKIIPKSEYYDEYLKALTDFYEPKFNSRKEAEEFAKDRLDAYLNIEEGDGQGYIPLEYYRLMQDLVGEWTPQQEDLYQKIVSEDVINAEDITQMFPPLKYQYSGNIKSSGLPVVSLHKFSLAPMIPGMMGNSNLKKLHDKMMQDGIAYGTFQTGSKINQMGKGDKILNEDNTFNNDVDFTPNVIYATYLKSQINVNKNFKGSNIFSTQMRKLILEGLYERGILTSKRSEPIVELYLEGLKDYTNLVTYEFLEEIGFYEEDGKFFMKSKDSLKNLLELVRNSLEQQDIIGNHLIDIIDVTANNNLSLDLSVHPAAKRIEKLILSQISKRIIKQKFNGEPLVQQSAALSEGLFAEPTSTKFEKASAEYLKKLKGSNFLPTYHQSKRMIDGKMQDVTAATKVVIALQGDFVNLLNIEYEGEVIGTVDRLNELIKDEDFVDQYRDQLTMVGVRIPVQGLNSMEFMEVFHFLPPGSPNVIISASELTAKGGGDFDVDKLTTYMPNINIDGTFKKQTFTLDEIKKLKEQGFDEYSIYDIIQSEKGALQNNILKSLRNILELPQNFVSLITPNSTSLLTPIADKLAEHVMEYNPQQSLMHDSADYILKNGKKKNVTSPTRIFEAGYNLYKHESNNIGKRTLGLGAVENTFNTLMTSLGAFMPAQYTQGRGANSHVRSSFLLLPHNKMFISPKTGNVLQKKTKDAKEVISISDLEDVNGINRIGDVISQMMNGWVDVEKDAWIFFIQGNYEVAPQLLYLVKAGVPVEEAIYFVSNPLVREYVRQQQLKKSTWADVLGTKPENPQFGVKFPAATQVIKGLDSVIADASRTLSSNKKRYQEGLDRAIDYFSETGNQNNEFTLEEMKDLVETDVNNLSVKQQKLAAVMFLHYLTIEQQIDALTQLKINMNPDTRTKTGGAVIEQSDLKIDELRFNDKLMPGIVEKFINDSVIGSYFKNDLGSKILEEIFPLRYNKVLVDFMKIINNDLQAYSLKKYGKRDMEAISANFRDELVNYIFQNVARKLDIENGYKNYRLNKSYKPKKAIELKFGAFVKDGQMYIDEKALRKEFREGKWKDTDISEGNYKSRGLFPLAPGTFTNKETNFNQYLHFVLERETLRSLKDKDAFTSTKHFAAELKITKQTNPKLSADEAKKLTFERMLAHEALYNVLNPYHLYRDPKYAYALQLSQMVKKYEDKLAKYDVLNILSSEQSLKDGAYYVFTTEKDYTNRISNLYRSQLEDLANPLVRKVPDLEENKRLSDLFGKLNIVGFMQTGVSASKYNVTNLIDPSEYLFIVQGRAAQFNEVLNTSDASQIMLNLEKFKEKYEALNIDVKRETVFKDYTVGEDILDVAEKKDKKEAEDKLYLIPSAVDNVEFYDSTKTKADYYDQVAEENPNKVFVYGYFLANVRAAKPVPYRRQGQLRISADEMSVGFPIGSIGYLDNLESFPPSRYQELIDLYERKFNEIDALIEDGVTVVFPKEGLGTLAMPSELFVYLSNKLVKYGLLNPGSTQYKDVQETLGNVQGISDAEIIEKLGLDQDPFVCPT